MTTSSAFHPSLTSAARPSAAGSVDGAPRVVLRLEAAAVLAAALVAYAHVGAGWGHFAALFLLPDLSMLGYLGGSRVGAAAYNTAHSYLGPALLAAAATLAGSAALLPAAIIWVAHIGFDRMLGYGLKYPSVFGATHLGSIGRDAAR
jgi:hypothetical protein